MIFSSSLVTAFLQQLVMGYINMLLIYRVGGKVFEDVAIAELAAYLYIFSFSIVYQVSFYSENTFVFFSLLGFYFIGQKSHQIVTAAFFFGLASLTRTTGVLLSVFIAYPMISKILKTRNCCKIFKYLMLSWCCAVMILSPLLVV
jgi:Gpi18-like mannosyltransferase